MLEEIEGITAKTPYQEAMPLMLKAIKHLDQRTEKMADGTGQIIWN